MTRSLVQLRNDVLAIARAGIRACDPASLTRDALNERLAAGGSPEGLHDRVTAIAAGKAAVAMARGARDVLGDRLRGGLIVAPSAEAVDGFESIAGGHPVPSEGSERGGRRALEIAASRMADEELLVLLSGGASALMAVPAEGLSLADKQAATSQLLRAGADIHALNTVRKHLSAIKGGRLAQRAGGRVRTLVISDVVGDDPSVIASGPTVADASTFAQARALVDRYGGATAYPAAVVTHLERGMRGEIDETPKPGDPALVDASLRIVGSRRDAMRGASDEASALGYHVVRIEEAVVGEARTAARPFLRAIFARAPTERRPVCVVSSGETTVTVRGDGKGGRNQEFALAAAISLGGDGVTSVPPPSPIVLASVGTDGVDGPTDAAGAIADLTTVDRARAAGLDPDAYLSANNAYAFFATIGDLVRTGPTGTNVGDLQVILLT